MAHPLALVAGRVDAAATRRAGAGDAAHGRLAGAQGGGGGGRGVGDGGQGRALTALDVTQHLVGAGAGGLLVLLLYWSIRATIGVWVQNWCHWCTCSEASGSLKGSSVCLSSLVQT